MPSGAATINHKAHHKNSNKRSWLRQRSLIGKIFLGTTVLWFLTTILTVNKHKSDLKALKSDQSPTLPVNHRNQGKHVRIQGLIPGVSSTPKRVPEKPSSWTAFNYTGRYENTSILVLITHPAGSTNKELAQTIQDVLLSPYVHVIVYISTSVAYSFIQKQFSDAITTQKTLSIYQTPTIAKPTVVSMDIQDDLNLAYILELAATDKQYTSISNFTLVLRAGMRLVRYDNVPPEQYPAMAMEHYQYIETLRNPEEGLNRTCWTFLSADPGMNGTTRALFLDATEHAHRMSLTLRSVLPYQRQYVSEILKYYCQRLMYGSYQIVGPVLFTDTAATSQQQRPSRLQANIPFLDARTLALPEWIDSSIPIGPTVQQQQQLQKQQPPRYNVAFCVTAMTRPSAGNDYLVQFMKELLQIIETDFMAKPTAGKTVEPPQLYQATIVILAGGNTLEEISTLRIFLEQTYTTYIANGVVRVIESPLVSYTTKLDNMHVSWPAERHLRRYWRSKQNLDIATLLNATVGLSHYVMLLEDDTGFQPGFGSSLRSTMSVSVKRPHGIPLWSAAAFGFGYSGILFHASDIYVYQQIHATFFDEQPCDLFKIEKLVRIGRVIQLQSRTKFANKKNSYLKHNGKLSSLEGKQQEVW